MNLNSINYYGFSRLLENSVKSFGAIAFSFHAKRDRITNHPKGLQS